jgi:hypothetical protein
MLLLPILVLKGISSLTSKINVRLNTALDIYNDRDRFLGGETNMYVLGRSSHHYIRSEEIQFPRSLHLHPLYGLLLQVTHDIIIPSLLSI